MADWRVPGFRASGVHCGIKEKDRDLALLVCDGPAAVAGVFTRSNVPGAPVELCRERVRRGRSSGVVVNSGISNVAMGARGRRDARAMAVAAERAVGAKAGGMMVASTGVIGEPLPMAKIRSGIRAATAALFEDGLSDAAAAIMTTDTFPKIAVAKALVGGKRVRIAGIAKGSGMIEPDMATMLSFLVTDAAATPAFLRRALRAAADESYNRMTVDGETSTSDTVLLFAGGAAGNAALRDARSAGASRFETALGDVTTSLARDLARDGEGATKLVTVRVSGARTRAEADRAARRIANSLLVKTAIFGRDPNWGRVIQTLGAADVRLVLARTEIRLGGVAVFARGSATGPAARRRAARALERPEVEIEARLGAGRATATVWTCDLSYDYVRINAEYTT